MLDVSLDQEAENRRRCTENRDFMLFDDAQEIGRFEFVFVVVDEDRCFADPLAIDFPP